jgi:formylglycine-generating enzyme required for sulfatase activity
MLGTTSLAPRVIGITAVVGLGAFLGLRGLGKRQPPLPPGETPIPPARAVTMGGDPPARPVSDDAMVDVPGGTYRMGSNDGDAVTPTPPETSKPPGRAGTMEERPLVEVTVAPLAVDATEVTVAAFTRCVSAGKCAEPDTGMYCNWRKPGRERHPVNCVDLKQATDYCAFAGKRLPTEEEWEYAARGRDGRRYPWGDGEPSAQLCWNGDGNDLGRGERAGTCPVASYPAGRSPFGAFDMAGNVWEWTASGYCPEGRLGCAATNRVIRGGAWNNVIPRYVRAQGRGEESPVSRHDNLGFRCVRNRS